MLDLVEGAKIIVGMTPSTAITAGADWINTENMHTVWAICTRGVNKSSVNAFEAQVAESYAGASAASVAVKVWNTTSLAIDRLFASTLTTGALSGSTKGAVIMKYDPTVSDTSDKYFSVVTPTSGWGCSVIYICEPRYGGYQQTIATTSST